MAGGVRPQMWPFSLSLLFAMLPAPPAVDTPPEKDAQAILRRAIKAHGGADKLARTRITRETTRGTVTVSERKTSFTAETLVRMPDQFRSVVTSEVDGAKRQVVQVFDGVKGWTGEGGVPREVGDTIVAGWKEMAHAAHV